MYTGLDTSDGLETDIMLLNNDNKSYNSCINKTIHFKLIIVCDLLKKKNNNKTQYYSLRQNTAIQV